MGFINKSNKIVLNAFYTQKGRTYYLNGTDQEKKPLYFSLGDSDTNYIIGSNSENVLDSGFVPDLSGNYDDCLKGVADGVDLKYHINYSSLNIDNDVKEIRFLNTAHAYEGINNLTVKVDLGKYISWLKKYGTYSINTTDPFNSIQPNLSSPLINFFDSIGVFNLTDNSIATDSEVSFKFSDGDFKQYQALNRFLLDTTKPNNFNLTVPSNNYQSSPLAFLFTSKNTTNLNKIGTSGLMINNRDYMYKVNEVGSSDYTLYSYNSITSGITLDTTKTYDILPVVILRYYKNGILNEELFKLRNTGTITNGNLTNANNQYLKLFVNDANKSLVVREAELLQDFITTRSDLFYSKNNVYYSKPLTIYVSSSDDTVNVGTLKISLFYDPTKTYTNTPNDTFTV